MCVLQELRQLKFLPVQPFARHIQRKDVRDSGVQAAKVSPSPTVC